MFPYAMLATTCIFYSNDWPKRFFLTSKLLREKLEPMTDKFYISGLSSHCAYEKIKDPKLELVEKYGIHFINFGIVHDMKLIKV